MNKILLNSTRLISLDMRAQTILQPIAKKSINITPLYHGIHSSNLLYCKKPVAEPQNEKLQMPEYNIFQRLYKKVFRGIPKSRLRANGYILLTHCSQLSNLEQFFRVFDMPDTFYSWFLVTELHVWMLSSRIMTEGEYGMEVRNALVEALWQDCELRAKAIGDQASSVRSKQILQISEEFQAALFIYDEGLLGGDKELANALYRRFFLSMYEREQIDQKPLDMEKIGLLVQYVRSTMHKLDNTEAVTLLIKGTVAWAPLLEKLDKL